MKQPFTTRNLKQERENNGWTLEYVSSQLHISKSALSDIERGRRNPSYNVLIKLEDLFHKNHRELLQNKMQKSSTNSH